MDSTLAVKVRLDIRDAFGYRDRCSNGSYSGQDCGGGKWVLRHTFMVSCLSEASYISQPSEADLFYYDPEHTEDEAAAIFHAWNSYMAGAGFGIVDNAYAMQSPNDSTSVWVDSEEREAPYAAVWAFGEYHWIEAQDFELNGDEFTFHHWQQYDFETGYEWGDPWYDASWSFQVGSEMNYHYYVAFYTGGDYWVTVAKPSIFAAFPVVDDYFEVKCWPSFGAFGTTVIDLYLSRDSGDTYQEVILNWPYESPFDWLVEVDTPVSNQCLIKAVIHDSAGNVAEGVSWPFSIYGCGDANMDGTCNLGDASIIVGYVYFGDPAPNPIQAGDPNVDGLCNLGDASYLINWIFHGGPAPQCRSWK